MDRRLVLAGLAASVAGPALAQTAQTTQSQQSSIGMRGSAADGSHQMGQAEMQHMQRTLLNGMVALETAKIAQEKARNERVKELAKFEREEQEGFSEVLHSMMEPMGTASTSQGASGQGTSGQAATSGQAMSGQMAAGMPAMQMEAKDREMVEKLRGMQAGAEFDRMFVQGQIQGHQELLQIQENYIRQGRNREHLNIAKLAAGRIREHIEEFQDAQRNLRG